MEQIKKIADEYYKTVFSLANNRHFFPCKYWGMNFLFLIFVAATVFLFWSINRNSNDLTNTRFIMESLIVLFIEVSFLFTRMKLLKELDKNVVLLINEKFSKNYSEVDESKRFYLSHILGKFSNEFYSEAMRIKAMLEDFKKNNINNEYSNQFMKGLIHDEGWQQRFFTLFVGFVTFASVFIYKVVSQQEIEMAFSFVVSKAFLLLIIIGVLLWVCFERLLPVILKDFLSILDSLFQKKYTDEQSIKMFICELIRFHTDEKIALSTGSLKKI